VMVVKAKFCGKWKDHSFHGEDLIRFWGMFIEGLIRFFGNF
jgi:hypothetical protein